MNVEVMMEPDYPSEFVGQCNNGPISIFINLSHMLREFNEQDYIFHLCRGFLVEFICYFSKYYKQKLCGKDCIPHEITMIFLNECNIKPQNNIYYEVA